MFKIIIYIYILLLPTTIFAFDKENTGIIKEYQLDCATKKIYSFINPSNSYEVEFYGSTKIRSFQYYAYNIKEINKKIICESNYEYENSIYRNLNLIRVPKNNRKTYFYIINNKKTSIK
tara:strand:- start:19239 stop:19595 length:357 start_codon:yes stop_codon:yes gene_type:complete